METLHLIQGQKGFELAQETKNWSLIREDGYSPIQMLVSATAACGGYVYQSILTNSHIPFTFKGIDVTYERDEEKKAHPIRSIHMTFLVSVPQEHQRRAQTSLKLVSGYCPVIQTLSTEVSIVESVEFV